MRRKFAAFLGVFLVGCAGGPSGPQVAKDRSAVYGVVTARPHKELLAKWSRPSEGPYDANYGPNVQIPADAIDYGHLKGIYVGLIDPRHTGGATHDIAFSATGAQPESLAVAVGDEIRIRNATRDPVAFFLAATEGDAFQDVGDVAAGATRSVRVRIAGALELVADRDDPQTAYVLARRGLRPLRLASGGSYVFNDLAPGPYRLMFWYWRLGSLERTVSLSAGKATRIDEVLSVDRTVPR